MNLGDRVVVLRLFGTNEHDLTVGHSRRSPLRIPADQNSRLFASESGRQGSEVARFAET
jgi:hypothetical protein